MRCLLCDCILLSDGHHAYPCSALMGDQSTSTIKRTDRNYRKLLERVVKEVEDPWFHEEYEGFNDCCMFCKSNVTRISEPTGFKYIHHPTCLWFDIHETLGLEVRSIHQRSNV